MCRRSLTFITIAALTAGLAACTSSTPRSSGTVDANSNPNDGPNPNNDVSDGAVQCPTDETLAICEQHSGTDWADSCAAATNCDTSEVCAAHTCLPDRGADQRVECRDTTQISLDLLVDADVDCEVPVGDGAAVPLMVKMDELGAVETVRMPYNAPITAGGALAVDQESCMTLPILDDLRAVDTGCPYFARESAWSPWLYAVAVDHPGLVDGPVHAGESGVLEFGGHSWLLTVGSASQLALWPFPEGDGIPGGGLAFSLERMD